MTVGKKVVRDKRVPVPLCPTEMPRGLPHSQSHVNSKGDSRNVTCEQTKPMHRQKDVSACLLTCHWESANKELSLLFLHLVCRSSGGAQF